MKQQGMPPPPPKKDSNPFKHKAQTPGPDFSGLRDDLNNLQRRVRIIEENVTTLRRSLQVAEQNMIGKNKYFSTEIKTLTSEIDEERKEINEIKDKILVIIRELENTANVNDVKVLEKYLQMWNPVKFVTIKEVEKIVDEKLSEQNKK